MVKVKLEDVIEQITFANESSKFFLNVKTGEIQLITEEVSRYAEDDIEDEALKEIAIEWCKDNNFEYY